MKTQALLLTLGLAVMSFGQDTIRFTHHYKVGDKVEYKTHMTMSMGADVTLDMTSSQTVAKVYDDGGADLTMEVPNMNINYAGNDMPSPAVPPRTVHVDSHGMPLKIDKDQQGVQLTKYVYDFFDHDLKVGQVIPIDATDVANNHTTGKMTLTAVANGVATVTGDLEETRPGLDGPMKMNFTFTMDTATSNLNKLEGTIQNMPTREGMPAATDVHVTMERVTG